MLDWVKKLFSASEATEINALMPGDAARSEVEGLNFASAIESHLRWKARLSDYIAGNSNENLEAATIALDDKCVLGQWIYGPGGRTFGNETGFEELRETHARFHLCAAEVVRKVDAGQRDEAGRLISTGDYAKTSMLVIRQLSALWNRLGKG
jgi:hypothetical protein